MTDENGQPTTLSYNPVNLRLIRADGANGAWAETEYNDSVFPYHVKSTSSLDASRSVSSWSFSNGRGLGFRSRSQTAGGYLSSDVEFDIMGRAVKSYNPYTVAGLNDARPGDIKFSEVVTRDGLGRTFQSLANQDMRLSNFDDAILKGADLSEAILEGASFDDAILDHANLSGADLYMASFFLCSLRRANLTNADMLGVDMVKFFRTRVSVLL